MLTIPEILITLSIITISVILFIWIQFKDYNKKYNRNYKIRKNSSSIPVRNYSQNSTQANLNDDIYFNNGLNMINHYNHFHHVDENHHYDDEDSRRTYENHNYNYDSGTSSDSSSSSD